MAQLEPRMQKPLLVIVFIALSLSLFSQGTYIPLGSDAYDYLNRFDVKYSKIIPIEHTADKPILRSDAAKIAETLLLSNLKFTKVQRFQLQYLVDENAEWLDSLHSKTKRPLWKQLYKEPASFLSVSSKKKGLFDLRFNPMLAANVGGESGGGGRFIFSRSVGLEVRGNIKQVFSFYFNATGNSERPPEYVTDKALIGAYRYVPGQAYWKDYSSSIFKFKDGIDYFDARGYVNVNILKYMNLTFGRDKNFIGDGIRSLFLSDYSAPYLFLKFRLKIWRFDYENIFAQLNSQYVRGTDQLLPKKYMATHHLSMQVTHWLNLGLFESVVMNRSDHFEFQYLNPIIFYRAVEHSLGSPDNVLIGGDFKANIASRASLYGQILFDEFNVKNFFSRNGWWANKWALQMGFKYIDIAPNLDGQIEFNMARPFTYTHPADINYTNYNQPLAHPLGANFYEIILNLRYQPIPKLTFNARYFVARVGDDTLINGTLQNYGGNIFTSSDTRVADLGNRLGQGAKGTINYFEVTASYQIWHNINFDAGILYRSKSTVKSPNNLTPYGDTFMFTIGARMNLAYNSKRYQF
ncbi:MAG: hypothetical protein JWO06_1313 [Bacteroidota bacterium]|nr:hypothetical protein [Bacteroidota bacterium]